MSLSANYHPLTEKGEQAFTLSMLIDVSEFESSLESVRNTYVTIVIVISLLLAALMISILNVTALAPLQRLGEQLRNIRRDKIISGNVSQKLMVHLVLENGSEGFTVSLLGLRYADVVVRWKDVLCHHRDLSLWTNLPQQRNFRCNTPG